MGHREPGAPWATRSLAASEAWRSTGPLAFDTNPVVDSGSAGPIGLWLLTDIGRGIRIGSAERNVSTLIDRSVRAEAGGAVKINRGSLGAGLALVVVRSFLRVGSGIGLVASWHIDAVESCRVSAQARRALLLDMLAGGASLTFKIWGRIGRTIAASWEA